MDVTRDKKLDDRLAPCKIRIIMGARRPKIIELNPSDLMVKSVKEIDADLSAIWDYAAMALGLRQRKATPADPPPPMPPGAVPQGETVEVQFKTARRAPNELPKGPEKPVSMTWVEGSSVHTVYSIIDRYPRGVDSLTLRGDFEKVYQGSETAAFARALQRLKAFRHIAAYKKRLFSYGRLKQFLEDLKANATDDIPNPERVIRGKWSAAVFECIRAREEGYVDFGEIVEHITKQKDFENVNNVGPQVAVALKNLQYRLGFIEKMKGNGKNQYRVKIEESKEQPAVDLEPSNTAH